MSSSIKKEYEKLLSRYHFIKRELLVLPLGYVSKKTINGKVQYYLQRRVGNKIASSYIKVEDVTKIEKGIAQRKRYETELVEIEDRISQLEKAATHIGKGLYCDLLLYKMASGMDDISKERKIKSASFAVSMNAVEGVAASEETVREISEWQNGTKKFINVFSSTLKRYGFPVGV